MNTLFLGIIAFVLLAWFILWSKNQKDKEKFITETIPSYQEVVEMNDEDFKKWLFIFESHREKILDEMISFEEENNIIQKEKNHHGREVSKSTQAVHDVFNREKSSDVVSFLNKLGEETGKDLVLDALLAKAATDRSWCLKKA